MQIQLLIDFLARYIHMQEDMVKDISAFSVVKTYPKDTILLTPGSISNLFYFVLEGCVRQYYLRDGTEKTTMFYTENQFVVPFESFTNKKPSGYYLQCLENCTLVAMSYDQEALLYAKYPDLEKLSRLLLQEELLRYSNYMNSLITMTPYERYETLLKTDPHLIKRVAGKYLSTFLGVQPESLSRLKKKALQKTHINKNQF